MECSACRNAIPANESFMRCVIKKCNKSYDMFCASAQNLTSDEKATWVCPECRCDAKKGGDNNLTPVGSKKSRDPNVTFRKKIEPVRSEMQHKTNSDELSIPITVHSVAQQSTTNQPLHELSAKDSTELSVEIRSLRSEMAIIRDQLTKAISLIACYETKLESYALQVVKLNTKLEGFENRVSQAPLPGPEPHTRTPTQGGQSRKEKAAKQSKPPATDSDLLKIPRAVNEVTIACDNIPGCSLRSESGVRSKETSTDDQQWTEVTRRKSRGPVSLYGNASPAVTTLKAAEPIKFLHLWNMASSAEEVLSYLRQLCSSDSCTVTELTARGSYKSYKIGVPAALYEKCYSIDVWPINARIKTWINYRQPAGPARNSVAAGSSSPARQPFRGASSAR